MLVIDRVSAARIPRIGEIVGVPSAEGSPPYLVPWLADEYESTILPGPGARIERGIPPRSACIRYQSASSQLPRTPVVRWSRLASAASGNVCPGDDLAESFALGHRPSLKDHE
jgi:hypothetical protein